MKSPTKTAFFDLIRTNRPRLLSKLSISDIAQGECFSSATVLGGAYLAGRYGVGVLVSLGNMLVMTWWIGPQAYGLFVTAVGLVAFFATLVRAGVDTYLVRHPTPPDGRLYNVAATLIALMSFFLMFVSAVITPLLIRWYGNRQFLLPYLVLLVTVPVTGLTGIPMAKLERDLNFRSIAGIELAAQSLGLATAVALACFRAGVWAPVAGQIVWQASTLLMAVVSASLKLRPQLDIDEARRMLSFGVGITASFRTWQLRTLVNPLLVGRFIGAEGVAFVALALRIAEALGIFRLAAGRMAIAALARLQERRDRFRKALEQALFFQIVTLGPLLCAFAWMGPFIVHHILGTRWMPSLAVYPFVAAGVLVNSVYNLQASALFVVGRQWVVLQSYAVHVLLLAGGTFLLLPRLGIVAYGWAELLACSAYLLIHSGLAKTAAISYRKLMPALVICTALLFLPAVLRFLSTRS